MRIFDTRALVGFTVGAGVAVVCSLAGASFAQQTPPAATPEAAPLVASAAPVTPARAAAPPLVVAACANKVTGVVTIKAKKHKACTKAETAIAFAATGPAGPAGPAGAPGGSGATLLNADGSLTLATGARFTSPNGLYELVVTDQGVGLKGPGGEISINGTTINQVKTTVTTP